MNFIDLAAQQERIRERLEKNIGTVLDHGQYIMGPEVGDIESQLAHYVGTTHAVSCASGTDALLLALMAYGVGPGDAVFTTPFTFIATAEVISLLGATPVFVDVDPRTFNIDPGQLETAIIALKSNDSSVYPLPGLSANLQPKGIIAVDLFGLPADYDAINAIAKKHALFVVEDAAQSFGGQYQNRKACSLADIACTSFFPAKPLGCYGDGGMCFTDDDRLAEVMRSVRVHGQGGNKYDNVRIGINGRMDTLQAAILLAKFEIFPEEVCLRNQAADNYNRLIRAAAGATIATPVIPSDYLSVWAQYSILVADMQTRAALQARLKDEGIPTAVYYPKPLHRQAAFAGLGYQPGAFPVSEDCSQRIFSLPMHPYLKRDEQEKVAALLAER
ncbi:MAG: DegT/DnrJ/EryC1/StrS family aminotransferase [Desulfosarcina sp.]